MTELVPVGSIGVDVFFTLSGFVVTLLILKEYRATGRLKLGVFYGKRLARLWPALLAVCAVVVAGGLVFPQSGWGGQAANAVPAAGYVMNLSNSGLFGASTGGNALSPTWTLAVEERFYLVWPVLLLVMLRFWTRRTVVRLTAVLAAAFLVMRFVLVAVGAPLARLYNGPDTRADQLLLGCVMALLFASISHGSRLHNSLASGARWAGPVAGAALVAALFWLEEPTTPGAWFDVFWTFGPAVLALLAAVVIGSMVLRPAGQGSRILGHPLARQPRPGPLLCRLPLAHAHLSPADTPGPVALGARAAGRGADRADGVPVIPLCGAPHPALGLHKAGARRRPPSSDCFVLKLYDRLRRPQFPRLRHRVHG